MKNLPNLFLPGFPKCGTNALAVALACHPEVQLANATVIPWPAFDKEPRFFHSPGRAPWCRPAYRPGKGRWRMDATPTYFRNGIPAMARAVPDARLFIMIREPVARLVSHWNHFKNLALIEPGSMGLWGTDPDLSLSENIAEEIAFGSDDLLAPGRYAERIAAMLNFFPREQIQFVFTEDLRARPAEVMARAFDFLNLEPTGLRVSEQNQIPQTDVRHPEELLERLREYYRPHNRALADLIGPLPSAWEL